MTFLGQVATRCYVPNFFNPVSNVMSITRHFARDNIANPQIAYANWIVNTTATPAEQGPGVSLSIKATLEYPTGVFTSIKFGGATVGIVATGTTKLSDAANVSIPKGSIFFIRAFVVPTTSGGPGIPCFGLGSAGANMVTSVPLGEGLGANATDVTNGGSVTDTGFGQAFFPVAIVAQTSKPSVLLIGDSRCVGYGNYIDYYGDTGELAPSFGWSNAYINAGVSGDEAVSFVQSHALRMGLLVYCTHGICEYGTNDIYVASRTSAQIISDLETIWSYFAGKPIFQSTITPQSNSTDSWTTVGNQSPKSAAHISYDINNYIRSNQVPLSGYFEIADIIEVDRNSSLWKTVPGLAQALTADGVHCNYEGYALIASHRPINPLVFYIAT